MAISNGLAVYGLSASGTHAGTNVTGTATIGVRQTSVALTAVDLAFSSLITAAANGNVATLDIETETWSQTTGSPTITDGDGNDFEGTNMSNMTTVHGLLLSAPSGNAGNVTVACSDPELPDIVLTPSSLVQLVNASGLSTNGTIAVTIASSGDSVTATLLGT